MPFAAAGHKQAEGTVQSKTQACCSLNWHSVQQFDTHHLHCVSVVNHSDVTAIGGEQAVVQTGLLPFWHPCESCSAVQRVAE